MHVEVDHPHAQQAAMVAVHLGLHQPCGHRDVVEHTVARALVGMRVMRAAGQIGGHPLAAEQCGARRADGGPHRMPCTFDHRP